MGVGGGLIFPNIYSSLAKIRQHTENWLYTLPGTALKVSVGGGWGWWFLGKISDQLWLSFSLDLAKPNN